MANHQLRGTKKRCQNEACGLPFYSLNRESYCCPNCGTAYDPAVERAQEEALAAARTRSRPGRSWANAAPEAVKAAAPDVAEVEDIADADDEIDLKDDASDVILESEDDEGDALEIDTEPETRLDE